MYPYFLKTMKRIIAIFIGLSIGISSFGATLTDLEAFTRAYGIVRYYSPNPYTEKWSERDWYVVCASLLRKTETLPIDSIFLAIAPNATFTRVPASDQMTYEAPAFYYEYDGIGEIKVPFFMKIFVKGLRKYHPYGKRLVRHENERDDIPRPGAVYSYQIGDSLWINLPHCLPSSFFDKATTDNLLKESQKEWKRIMQAERSDLSGRESEVCNLLSDRFIRLTDIVTKWTVVRHFYPYYEEECADWDERLRKMIERAETIEITHDLESYNRWYACVQQMMNPVEDGHLMIHPNIFLNGLVGTYLPSFYAPVIADYVDGQVVVKDISDKVGCKFQRYDTVVSVEGVKVLDRLDSLIGKTNAATSAARKRTAVRQLFASSTYGDRIPVTVIDVNGLEIDDTLRSVLSEPYHRRTNREFITKLSDNLFYLDAASTKADGKHFDKFTGELQHADGLIVDLRGFPSLGFEDILARLTPRDLTTPVAEIPVSCWPNRGHLRWTHHSETLEAKLPTITCPVVFLADERTVSWGETILMMVRGYKLGLIVGAPTAGTTGDLTTVGTPIFDFTITGMKMQNIDGTPHHGIGIIPDITVEPTVAGLQQGRDEVLEKAVEFLKENKIANSK